MQNANEHLSSICDQVLHSDTSIRFVGIPNKWVNWPCQDTEMD